MEIVALCDVAQSTLDKVHKRLGAKPRTYHDFRELIDQDDIDAVVVAAPDHWHPIMTITACNAGKDVYVEKPVSYTVHEGRKMVEAARRKTALFRSERIADRAICMHRRLIWCKATRSGK